MHALEQRIGHVFDNSALLREALNHPSLGRAGSNQRLEFLGDSVLGAVVANLLYDLFPHEPEGDLAKRLAGLVRGDVLAEQARAIGLDAVLAMSDSEEAAGGRQNPSNLEDAFEALIGALFLDGGYEAAEKFIAPRWQPLAQASKTPPKDAKTRLQEWAQGLGKPLPEYHLRETTGPAHAPLFTIEVMVKGCEPQQASAASKRAAEQIAAEALLNSLSGQKP